MIIDDLPNIMTTDIQRHNATTHGTGEPQTSSLMIHLLRMPG